MKIVSSDRPEYLLLINSMLFVLFVGVFGVVLSGAWATDPVSTSFVLPLSGFGLIQRPEGLHINTGEGTDEPDS